MTAFIIAVAIAVGILGIGATWLILRREDTRPLSVPGRDAPESPATTGPPGPTPDWWRDGEPGIPAGGSNVPPGDTAVPAPASLPEGDEPAARPPQEAPAREPSPLTAGDLLAKATAAMNELPVSDYLDEVGKVTAYDGDAPWSPFSDVTLTRIRAIKDGVT